MSLEMCMQVIKYILLVTIILLILFIENFDFSAYKVRKAHRMVERGEIETDPNKWSLRDFITKNTVIDEKFRIVEIDLRDYDISHTELVKLRKVIYEEKIPYASIVRIKGKECDYNTVSSLFSAISEGDYSFPLDEFRDIVDLMKINNSFSIKKPKKENFEYFILRQVYILTGIKEVTFLGECTKKKAVYNPFKDTWHYK